MSIAVAFSRELASELEILDRQIDSSVEEIVLQAVSRFVSEIKEKTSPALKVVDLDDSRPFRRHMRIP